MFDHYYQFSKVHCQKYRNMLSEDVEDRKPGWMALAVLSVLELSIHALKTPLPKVSFLVKLK